MLKFHQVSSKCDEKQKSFINSLFFCSEFQSVSRIVKIAHSAVGAVSLRLPSYTSLAKASTSCVNPSINIHHVKPPSNSGVEPLFAYNISKQLFVG